MARLFISHSSRNDHAALALQSWLFNEGWTKNDIYLDISADSGMSAGQKWVEALDDAQYRCEAVVFLVSQEWLSAKWCREEYTRAQELNKKLFALIIDPTVDLSDLPTGLTAQWQAVWLVPPGDMDAPTQRFDTKHPIRQDTDLIRFTDDGLKRLRNGLHKAAISPDTFALQKDPSGPMGWRMPYRGLEPLQAEDAAVFFGRDAEIARGLDMLRGMANNPPPRFMVILGASGAGKSSFLRAGLLPRIIRDDINWIAMPPLRTGDEGPIEGPEGLLSALRSTFAKYGSDLSRSDLRNRIGSPPDFISTLKNLRGLAAKTALIEKDTPEPIPVLSIDQAEELFNADAQANTSVFWSLINQSMRDGELLCIATIRSDRYGSLQSETALEGIKQTTFSLPPVATGEYGQIINGPTQIWRLAAGNGAPEFAPDVSQALLTEVKGQDDALPLLAFAMARLIRDNIGSNNTGPNFITVEDLQASGGIAKIIAQEGERALRDAGVTGGLKERDQILSDLFIPRLTRINGDTREPERRVAALSDFKDKQTLELIDAFVARRLLTKKSENDLTTIEVTHEALLRNWPMLKRLLDAEADDFIRLDGALQAAAQWEDNGKSEEFIVHRGSRLQDAQSLGDRGQTWNASLTPAQPYLSACYHKEIRDRNRRTKTRFSIIVATLFSFLTFAYLQAKQIDSQRKLVKVKSDLVFAALESNEQLKSQIEISTDLFARNLTKEVRLALEKRHFEKAALLYLECEELPLISRENPCESTVHRIKIGLKKYGHIRPILSPGTVFFNDLGQTENPGKIHHLADPNCKLDSNISLVDANNEPRFRRSDEMSSNKIEFSYVSRVQEYGQGDLFPGHPAEELKDIELESEEYEIVHISSNDFMELSMGRFSCDENLFLGVWRTKSSGRMGNDFSSSLVIIDPMTMKTVFGVDANYGFKSISFDDEFLAVASGSEIGVYDIKSWHEIESFDVSTKDRVKLKLLGQSLLGYSVGRDFWIYDLRSKSIAFHQKFDESIKSFDVNFENELAIVLTEENSVLEGFISKGVFEEIAWFSTDIEDIGFPNLPHLGYEIIFSAGYSRYFLPHNSPVLIELPDDDIDFVKISDDLRFLLSGNSFGAITVWDFASGTELGVFNHSGDQRHYYLIDAIFDLDNEIVWILSNEGILGWNWKRDILGVNKKFPRELSQEHVEKFGGRTFLIGADQHDSIEGLSDITLTDLSSEQLRKLSETKKKLSWRSELNKATIIFNSEDKLIIENIYSDELTNSDVDRCLDPSERIQLLLIPDPPCWCQEKTYPKIAQWNKDYLDRNPEIKRKYLNENSQEHRASKQENWFDGDNIPNSFTDLRSDGTVCPVWQSD